ncbi:MAG: hypothetical protein RLZZ546_2910, partial [Bacteroidota bacterium]
CQNVYSKLSKEKYIHRMYFPETKQITHYTEYLDSDFKIKNGKILEWWDDGKIRFEGNMTQNKSTGEWKHYNSKTGSLMSKGKMINNYKIEKWVTFYDSSFVETEYFNEGKDYIEYHYKLDSTLIKEMKYSDHVLTEVTPDFDDHLNK